MNNMKYFFINILILLFLVTSVTANNVIPPVEKPLPTRKIEIDDLLKFSNNIENQLVSVASDIDKKGKKENKKSSLTGTNGFQFAEADAILLNESEPSSILNTEVDPMTNLLVELGTGDYSAKIKKARGILDKATDVLSIISQLDGGNLAELPLKIEKEIGNVTTKVVFHSMELKPQYAEITVYAGVVLPQTDVNGDPIELYFAADDIKFSYEGGVVGSWTLGLLANIAFPLGGSNAKAAIVLNAWHEHETPYNDAEANNGTFITIGCEGVEEFGIEADIVFSREWLIPTDEFGNPLPNPDANNPKRVSAHFAVLVQDWNNMLFEGITIDHFVLNKYRDVSFYVGNANIDLSDFRNPASLEFPSGYDFAGTEFSDDDPSAIYAGVYPEGNVNLWRGVYIETVEITMPKPFKKNCDSYGGLGIPIQDENMEGLASVETNRLSQEEFLHNLEDLAQETRGGPNSDGYTLFPEEEIAVPKSVEDEEWTDFKPTVDPGGCRIKVGAENLLIDKTGVSGFFYIKGEAPIIGGGVMDGGWSWSLDYIGLGLLQSNVNRFEFGGVIGIPIADDTTPVGYSGKVLLGDPDVAGDETYNFQAKLEDDLKFPIWNAAEVSLLGGSFIDITVVTQPSGKKDFRALANLTGKMSIGKTNGAMAKKAELPSVSFQGLILSTQAPYLDLAPNGSISLDAGSASQTKMKKFPITVNAFELSKQGDTKVNLRVVMGVNILGEDEGGVSGQGAFSLKGKLVTNGNGVQKWVYDGFNFEGAYVEANFAGFSMQGTIMIFDEHPIYDDGFYGKLACQIMEDDNGNAKIEIELAAIFGKKEGFRYFMVDGYVGGSAISIPIFPPIELNGFGGGAFYRMRQADWVDPFASDAEVGMVPGVDLSGIVFEPDASVGLGLKFCVGFTAKANTINGKLSCYIRFSSNMALQNIMFYGVAEFFEGIDIGVLPKKPEFLDRIQDLGDQAKMNAQDEAAGKEDTGEDRMSGRVGISLDFENGFAFHGFAEVKLNLQQAGITGTGAMDLLIDPANNDWHLFIGGYTDGSVMVPDFVTGSEVSLLPLHVGMTYGALDISADVYFLLGTNIPGPPPIHPGAADFFGTSGGENNRADLNCNGRTPAQGTGIAFGASAFFKLQKEKRKGCLRGYRIDIRGGVGFDVSLLKFNKNVTCSNPDAQPNNNKPIGIKGFRITGRIWAFLEIKGGRVICIPLPRVGIGAKIEADITNPSYFDARVYVKFFGKNIKFGIKLGDQCGRLCTDEAG